MANQIRINAGTTLTEAQAKRLGYTLTRGDYPGGTDDRAEGWYWQYAGSETVDRRGKGSDTKREALIKLTERLARFGDIEIVTPPEERV